MNKNYTLNYIKTGEGKTILFLHGLLSSHKYWDSTLELLRKDYEVFAVDLLGFGDSEKPSDALYTVDEQVAAVFRTLKYAKITPPITLVGHSMGSLIAIRFSAAYPKMIEHVILCNTPLFGGTSGAKDKLYNSGIAPKILMKGETAQMICRSFHHFPFIESILRYYPHKLPGHVKTDVLKHTWESYSRSMTNLIETYSPIEDLKLIRNKTTMLVGGKDKVVSMFTASAILPPGILPLVFKEANHHIPLVNTKELANVIKEVAR